MTPRPTSIPAVPKPLPGVDVIDAREYLQALAGVDVRIKKLAIVGLLARLETEIATGVQLIRLHEGNELVRILEEIHLLFGGAEAFSRNIRNPSWQAEIQARRQHWQTRIQRARATVATEAEQTDQKETIPSGETGAARTMETGATSSQTEREDSFPEIEATLPGEAGEERQEGIEEAPSAESDSTPASTEQRETDAPPEPPGNSTTDADKDKTNPEAGPLARGAGVHAEAVRVAPDESVHAALVGGLFGSDEVIPHDDLITANSDHGNGKENSAEPTPITEGTTRAKRSEDPPEAAASVKAPESDPTAPESGSPTEVGETPAKVGMTPTEAGEAPAKVGIFRVVELSEPVDSPPEGAEAVRKQPAEYNDTAPGSTGDRPGFETAGDDPQSLTGEELDQDDREAGSAPDGPFRPGRFWPGGDGGSQRPWLTARSLSPRRVTLYGALLSAFLTVSLLFFSHGELPFRVGHHPDSKDGNRDQVPPAAEEVTSPPGSLDGGASEGESAVEGGGVPTEDLAEDEEIDGTLTASAESSAAPEEVAGDSPAPVVAVSATGEPIRAAAPATRSRPSKAGNATPPTSVGVRPGNNDEIEMATLAPRRLVLPSTSAPTPVIDRQGRATAPSKATPPKPSSIKGETRTDKQANKGDKSPASPGKSQESTTRTASAASKGSPTPAVAPRSPGGKAAENSMPSRGGSLPAPKGVSTSGQGHSPQPSLVIKKGTQSNPPGALTLAEHARITTGKVVMIQGAQTGGTTPPRSAPNTESAPPVPPSKVALEPLPATPLDPAEEAGEENLPYAGAPRVARSSGTAGEIE
ncbi:MAG: hypothetical protein HQL59_13150, partial [Magnetococcales bacterium]|nr:hypothetical protein [Magnetococcales bacterium]